MNAAAARRRAVPVAPTPIFDKDTWHVGWFCDGKVFDLHMRWLAFAHDGHLFDATTLDWLGPLLDGSLIDRTGRPVAWLLGAQPRGIDMPLPPMRPPLPKAPMRPVRPIAPRRPLFPRHPLGGWSTLAWAQWIGLPPAPGEVPPATADEPAPSTD